MASIVTSLQRFQLDAYFNAAALSVLAYDFTLTFDDEVELIWKTKWNLTKVLWFFTRYPAFIDSTLSIYHQVGTDIAIRTCGILYNISGWMFLWGIWVAEIILIIRTWAIWGRNQYIGGTLFVILCGLWAVSAVYLNQFLHSFTFVLAKNISPFLTGCVITSSGNELWTNFVILMIFESIILTLTAIKGIQQFRRSSSPLVVSLYRDGIIFYIYLFSISLINVVVLLTAPAEYSILITSLQRNIHCICSARLLLNLRAASLRGTVMLNGNAVQTTTFVSQGTMEFERRGLGTLLTVDDGTWASGADGASSVTMDGMKHAGPVEMSPISGGYGRRNPTGSRGTGGLTASSTSTRV